MKVELLTTKPVPCTDIHVTPGMTFDVVSPSRVADGLWIQHLGHLIFLPQGDYRVIDQQTRSHDFVARRACLSK